MAKPKAVPDSNSRESPAFWTQMWNGHEKRHERVATQLARFTRWHRGDLRDVVDPAALGDSPMRWESSLENMTSLATAASLADLFFRFPRYVVRPFSNSDSPLFSAGLARCETIMLAHTLRKVGYRSKARRALQDALLGPLGILKITVDSELAVDQDTLEAARMACLNEIKSFLETGQKMNAKEDQIHSIYIELKSQLLAQAERGEIMLPRPALKYLRKNIAEHEKMKGSERPTETFRSSSVRIQRVNFFDYAYDPTVDDRSDASWKAHRFLLRKTDILANEDYDEDARKQLIEAQDRWEIQGRTHTPSVQTAGSYDIPEEMVAVVEVHDFVDQKKRLYCEGGSLMLKEEDRGDLSTIQPSGPFEDICFIEDALEGIGVPPPALFEAEQAAATHLASTNVRAALQSIPRILFNSRDIDPAQMEQIWKAAVGQAIPIDPKSPPGTALENSFAQAPIPEISDQTMQIQAGVIRGIERRSGLGSPKMGGGDFANTATASALIADASTSLSEDRGATVDDWSERSGRQVVRLLRRFAPLSQWVEVCGPEAIEVVPERFSIRDVCNDIAVEVVPGSSRRRNTAVDQKGLLELVAAMTADPAMQTPAGVSIRTSIYRLYSEDSGITGLDWNALDKEQQMMAAMQQAMGGAPPGSEEGGPPVDQEAPGGSGAPEGTSEEDINQGVANVGGGRVSTGAAVGDRVRSVRGEAKERVLNRV